MCRRTTVYYKLTLLTVELCSYLLTLTSFQPLYGKLCDIFGRKACLLFSYAVFGIGCLGCGLAQSMVQLCLARAVTGIGGAGMSSVVSIVLTDLVPLRDRGLWQGYLNVIFVLGMSGGAPLGGIIADTVGWRWCVFSFFVSDIQLQPEREKGRLLMNK